MFKWKHPIQAEVHCKKLAVQEMGVYTKKIQEWFRSGMQEALVVLKITHPHKSGNREKTCSEDSKWV